MRLPEARNLPLGAALVLAAMLGAGSARAAEGANGPAADFPVVTGEPYTVADTSFTPANTMNYDAVGHASVGEGAGFSAAHHTLPLPSYVEVTSLSTGKTVLVRVDRRGPMQATNLIELSPAAAQALGVDADNGVRVRRVNPPEAERALLRDGGTPPERMATPKALLAVLARRLPAQGTVQLSSGAALEQRVAVAAPVVAPKPVAAPRVAAKPKARPSVGAAFAMAEDAAKSAPKPAQKPAPVKPAVVKKAAPAPVELAAAEDEPAPRGKSASGSVVVQAGAYSVKANAQSVAKRLGARLDPAGKVWRVRMGPFVNIADAEAALAKARAAGYTARIQHAE
ncbi:MAG: SPOR domain-containing protein [Proteobacteria bacterium]|nr:SPOR domain-containing protein [Pseudomonadota bacterium]